MGKIWTSFKEFGKSVMDKIEEDKKQAPKRRKEEIKKLKDEIEIERLKSKLRGIDENRTGLL